MKAINAYTQMFGEIDSKDILRKIELIGRTCYKSEGKIKEDSAEKFVANLIKRGHEAMLEHASFIVEVEPIFYQETIWMIRNLEADGHFKSFLRLTLDTRPIISGNVRAWREFFKAVLEVNEVLPGAAREFIKSNPVLFPEFQDVSYTEGFEDVFKILNVSDLETMNEKLTHWDETVKFVVDRGISHEIVRHRIASFAQESTRYCNYAKDDFGKEITFIIPSFLSYGTEAWKAWKEQMLMCENAYFKLLDIGLTSEEARTVLPISLKTEIVMTANLREWKHFFNLRAANKTGKAHPQMLEVARPLLDEFKSYIPVVFDDITY